MAREQEDPGPIPTFFGGNTGITYEELKRRRAIAAALASRQRGFPKNIGEGLTYFGESVGELIAEARLREMEKAQRAGDISALTPPAEPAPRAAPAQQSSVTPEQEGMTVAALTPPEQPAPAPEQPPAPPPEPPAPAPMVAPPMFAPKVTAPGFASRFDAAYDDPRTTSVQPPPSFDDRFNAVYASRTADQPTRDQQFNPQRAQGGIEPMGPAQADLTPSPVYSPLGPPAPAAGPPVPPMELPLAAVNPAVDPRSPRPGGAPAVDVVSPDQFNRLDAAAGPARGGFAYSGRALPPAWEAAIARQPPELQDYLRQMALKETGLRENVTSTTGASGPLQFTRGTGATYGLRGAGGDRRNDPDAAFDAGTKLTLDNARKIEALTGKPATYQELARAHQQGFGGFKTLHEGGLPSARNLAVNRLNPGAGAAGVTAKLDAYYGFPPGAGSVSGGGTAVASNPREAATAALMQQPQGPPSPQEIRSEALLAEVVGGGRGQRGFPATASLGRAGVGTDVPSPGVSPMGPLPGINDAVQQRQRIYDAVQQQQQQPQPTAPEVPQPDPTQAGVSPPTMTTSMSPPPSISTGPSGGDVAARFAQARNVGTIDDSGMVISGARPLGPAIPEPQITPIPRQQAQPPKQEGPPEPPPFPDPGPEPAPPRANAVMQHYQRVASDPDRSDAVRAEAARRYTEERTRLLDIFSKDYTLWKENKQKQQAYELDLPAKREALRAAYYENLKKPQDIIAPTTQAPPAGSDPRIGTPQSPQRTGIPTAPPVPPGVTPQKWSEVNAPQLVKAIEAVDKAAPNFDDALKSIRQARHHPGREWGVGTMSSVATQIPGTDAYGFGKLMAQIGGKNFLSAYQQLKGGGAITEIEGTKAEAAQARLATAQTKEDWDTALNDLELTLRRDLELAQRKVNQPVTAWRAPGDNASYAPDLGERRGNNEYIGGNPSDPASWKRVR